MTDQTKTTATPETDSHSPAQRRAAWGLLLQQLAAARTGAPLKRARYNPRPPGQVREGSATAVVLALMQAHPKRRWRRAQLLILTGRTESAVDWALAYLCHQGLIERGSPRKRARLQPAQSSTTSCRTAAI